MGGGAAEPAGARNPAGGGAAGGGRGDGGGGGAGDRGARGNSAAGHDRGPGRRSRGPAQASPERHRVEDARRHRILRPLALDPDGQRDGPRPHPEATRDAAERRLDVLHGEGAHEVIPGASLPSGAVALLERSGV